MNIPTSVLTFSLGVLLTLVLSPYAPLWFGVGIAVVPAVLDTNSEQAIIRLAYPEPTPIVPLSELHGIDALELVKLFHEMFETKEAAKPQFLILFGPPGSGKTQIINKMLRHTNTKLKNYAELIVDHMLGRISPYKTEMAELLAKRPSMDEGEFLLASQAIYGKYRPIIKYFSAMLLEIALRQRLNILFETTGSNTSLTVQTIIHARRIGYEISVVYPYVATDELIRRVDKRNTKIGRAIPSAMVTDMEDDALNNFGPFLQFVDSAHVYDNNGAIDAPLFELFSKSERENHQPGESMVRYRCHTSLSQYGELHSRLQSYCPDPAEVEQGPFKDLE